MTNNKQVLLIEQYLTGTLSAKDGIRVELLILTDEAFGKLYNNMKAVFDFISYQGRGRLSNEMKAWEFNLPIVSMANNNQEKIEQFLVGKLSVDEILEFEKKLENDPQFKQQFEESKLLYDGIQYDGRKKLMKRMQRIEADLDGEEPQRAIIRPMNLKRLFVYAAGIMLLLAATFLIKQNFSTSATDIASLDLSQTYPSDIIQRSPIIDSETMARIQEAFPDHEPKAVYEAFLAYEGENYEKAISDFQTLLSDSPSATLSFYKAQALLANEKPLEAVLEFDVYLKSKEQRYSNPSMYYKGLALLKAGKTSETKQLWNSFAKEDCHYCEKANELLKNIK